MSTQAPINLKTLRILHLALCAGVMMFLIVSVIIQTTGGIGIADAELNQILLSIAGALALLGCIASLMIFRSRMNAIRQLDSYHEKIKAYRGTSILRWAMLEGPALFGVVVYLLTANKTALAIVAIPLVLLVLSAPTRDRMIQDTGMSEEEAAAFAS